MAMTQVLLSLFARNMCVVSVVVMGAVSLVVPLGQI